MVDLLARLTVEVLLPEVDLIALIRSAPHRYKVYEIPKRKEGEFRTIAQPAREVKVLQYWVMRHVLKQFPVHKAATAYRKGKSIAHNAQPHVKGRFILKLDFKDFFPSIRPDDFRALLQTRAPKSDDRTIDLLCSILFWKPKRQSLRLSIGAPSSPMVSNILMAEFDNRVSTVCRLNGVVYTRYADDLTFSARTSDALSRVEREVKVICAEQQHPRLALNKHKLVRRSKRDSRRVTGLVLTNDQSVSLGREMKRQLRAATHHLVTGRLDEEQRIRLRGMLAYVNSVEPTFLQRLWAQYGRTNINEAFERR